MKKIVLIASVVFALGYTAAIAAQFAGLISFNLFSLPVLIGGAISSGLVGLAIDDYSHRPSFRVRSPRVTKLAAKVSTEAADEPTTMWTYATRSA